MKELYLTGNPCENWSEFKDYTVAALPQISFLDGNEILKSERIRAAQKFPELQKLIKKAALENQIKKEYDPDKDNPNRYTIEYRRKLYKEMEEEKINKDKDRNNNMSEEYQPDYRNEPASVYKNDGEIRICNHGKYEFYIDQDIFRTGITTFELKLPKYLDTSQIKVDLNPQYVRVQVKNKVTQIKFDHEILSDKGNIQRSTTTGHLLITAPIAGIKPRETPDESEVKKSFFSKPEKKKIKPLNADISQLTEKNKIEVVKEFAQPLLQESKQKAEESFEVDPDIDLSEIPDLD